MADFDIDWPHGHQTRQGEKVRIICTDRKGPAPIIALVEYDDREQVVSYTKDGRLYSGVGQLRDLINAPPRTAYANVYANALTNNRPWDYDVSVWSTRAQADEKAGPARVARIKITEGQFDE